MKKETIKRQIRKEAAALGHDLGRFHRTLAGYSVVCARCRWGSRMHFVPAFQSCAEQPEWKISGVLLTASCDTLRRG